MARQKSFFPYSGQLRDLIGYQRDGEYFLRRRPGKVRQTIRTRNAAQRFGLASRRGAFVRKAFYEHLDLPCDNRHINRLNSLFITNAGNTDALTGFRFNQHTGIDRFLTTAPKLFRNEVLHIPRQTLIACKSITMLELKVIAIRLDFDTLKVTGRDTVTTTIDPHEPFNGIEIPLNANGEGTLIIALQIRGMNNGLPSGNKQYLAADIVAIKTPQLPAHPNNPNYTHQTASAAPKKKPDYASADAYPAIIQRE